MQKLSTFLSKSISLISQQTTISLQVLQKDINVYNFGQQVQSSRIVRTQLLQSKVNSQSQADIIPLTVQNISFSQRPLQQLQLEQSKIIQLQRSKSTLPTLSQMKNSRSIKISIMATVNESRIRQIELQKRRVMQQLRKLDSEIVQIKKERQGGESLQRSQFHKKTQIADDVQAQRQAQSLIKQLHVQKRKIEQRKRKVQQMQLQKRKRQDQQNKKQRQQSQRRLRQQKRLLIQRRLQQQRKKRQQRHQLQKQSNQLIIELKKQQQLVKQRQLIPGQLLQYQHKKKLLQKKNLFDVSEIQQHQVKYKEIKEKENQLRRERSESIKLSKPMIPKYAKNVWVERLEEEEVRRRQEEKMKELQKKMQLEKRMQYGNVVKTIFMGKQKKREESIQRFNSHQESVEGEHHEREEEKKEIIQHRKPQTPNVSSNLPPIPGGAKRQNQTDKKFKQRQVSSSILELKNRSRLISRSNQQLKQKEKQKLKNPVELEKIQKQKLRQLQLRKQTKQRLKKLQNQSIEIPKTQKVKYQNYISKVKVKRQSPHQEWKKIMSNDKLSKEQKYKEMLNKAAHMENQAKIKEDLRKNGDEDAVNLYIGSIQAKLALLQRF